MMNSQDLLPIFYVEAVNCANYIQNCTPHQALYHIPPKEAWSGTKPNVPCFRVFGSNAWAVIPKTKRKALEKKIKPLIFLSQSEDMKAYRLIDHDTYDILFHTYIQFDEFLPDSPSSSPFLILLESYDTSFEVFYVEDIIKVLAPTETIDPPTLAVTATPPVDVAYSSTFGSCMPKWARSTLEVATPFMKDLSFSLCYSIDSSLFGQVQLGNP